MILQSDVLVVDDEDVVVSAVSRILKAYSVEHRVAQSAEEALERIREKVPDIVLADIKLPGRSGLDLVRTCSESHPSIVSVCMTGYANAEHVLLSLDGGAVDFLPKPFTVEEVMSTLRRASELVSAENEADVPESYYFLDGHSWARPADDGTLTIGVVESFLRTVEPIEKVDVPSANTMLRQGGVLARMTVRGGEVHRVWSAAGGRVQQSNRRLEGEPGLISEEPYEAGWIACVMPTSVDDEVARLGRA